MFDDKEFFKSQKTFFFVLAFLCISLFFFNLFGTRKNVSNVVEAFVKPIEEVAFVHSESFKSFFGIFEEIKTLRTEYYDLQEKYLELEAKKDMLVLLEEENVSLKEQLNVYKVEHEIIPAEVLFQDWALRNESLLINKGLVDGIEQGDIVTIGLMYVGVVSDVYEFTSKVRLPTSRASSLKVMILENVLEFENDITAPQSFLSGIAIGYSNILKIENIETYGNLVEGSVIVLNDQKIGKYLYLGKVLSIDDDPTASLRSCTVEVPIDYSNLKYVYVRKDK